MNPPVRFSELVRLDTRPPGGEHPDRRPVATDSFANELPHDPRNSGFATGLVEAKTGKRLRTSRRGFLRSAAVTAAAGTALSVGRLFGPAKRVEAQTGIVGQYPRRIAQFCPPYNTNDNCQPGCGSSPICTDCCTSDGYFRNDPANGYSLYPGGCGDGDIADGWLWRYAGTCGSCASIEYRCSDGYVQTDTGPAPFICRWVTQCEPLPDGAEPGPGLADAARPTNWRPAGALEWAADNGETVSLRGWIADGSQQPISMRVTANGQIVSIGTAGLARPDIARSVPGAGPNTGFSVNLPLTPGPYRLCVDALNGPVTATVACVNLEVGSGSAVSGPGASGSISTSPAETTDPDAPPAPTPTAGPTPTPAPSPTPTPVPVVPAEGPRSDSPSFGAVAILRRNGPGLAFVSGWAAEADTDEASFVEAIVDGEAVRVVRPDLPRPDVVAAFPELGPNTGFAFSFAVPTEATEIFIDTIGPDDGWRRRLAQRVLNPGIELPADEDSPELPTASGGARAPTAAIYGSVVALEIAGDGTATARGWAFDPNEPSVAVTVELADATTAETAAADLREPSVQRIYGVAGNHGFEVTLALAAGEHDLTLVAYNGDGPPTPLIAETVVVP